MTYFAEFVSQISVVLSMCMQVYIVEYLSFTPHSFLQMVSRNLTLASNLPSGGFPDEKEEEEEEWIDSPHVVGPSIHRPKDPRSRHKYNILSRLFDW